MNINYRVKYSLDKQKKTFAKKRLKGKDRLFAHHSLGYAKLYTNIYNHCSLPTSSKDMIFV